MYTTMSKLAMPFVYRTLHNWHFPFSLNPLLIGNANCAIYVNRHALPLSQLALCTMPFLWYCMPENAHRTIGIRHFHSDHYWLSMPIVQSAETHKQYCIFGIVYNAIYAVLLMGSRRLQKWHCVIILTLRCWVRIENAKYAICANP